MGERIGMGLTQIAALADHLAFRIDDDRADRHLAVFESLARQRQRAFHLIVPPHSNSV